MSVTYAPAHAPVAPPAPRRHRTRKSTETRYDILEATVNCLVAHGYHRTNISRIAEIARVTRGCVQYYFPTAEDALLATCTYASTRGWELYESAIWKRAQGMDAAELAIDLIGTSPDNKYRVALAELMSAARTEPKLRPYLQAGAKQAEAAQRLFTARLFKDDAVADTVNFRRARDLTQVVADWMFIHVFPDEDEARRAGVVEALRAALHLLWNVGPEGAGAATDQPPIPSSRP